MFRKYIWCTIRCTLLLVYLFVSRCPLSGSLIYWMFMAVERMWKPRARSIACPIEMQLKTNMQNSDAEYIYIHTHREPICICTETWCGMFISLSNHEQSRNARALQQTTKSEICIHAMHVRTIYKLIPVHTYAICVCIRCCIWFIHQLAQTDLSMRTCTSRT